MQGNVLKPGRVVTDGPFVEIKEKMGSFIIVKAKDLDEAQKLNLEDNHFYFVLLGELYKKKDAIIAKSYFQKAQPLAKTETEKQEIQKKINVLA